MLIMLLSVATGTTIFGQEKQDTIYGIELFTSYSYSPDIELKWNIQSRYLRNDTTLHAIYLFGIDKERNINLIDSMPNMCDRYYLTNKEMQKYKSFFVGYTIGNTFLRSDIAWIENNITPPANRKGYLSICQNGDMVELDSSKVWFGSCVINRRFIYPGTNSAGAYIVMAADTILQVTIMPSPYIMFVNLPKKITKNDSAFSLESFVNLQGGTFTGKGIIEGIYFDPARAGVGKHKITYTYTHPTYECSTEEIQYITVSRRWAGFFLYFSLYWHLFPNMYIFIYINGNNTQSIKYRKQKK